MLRMNQATDRFHLLIYKIENDRASDALLNALGSYWGLGAFLFLLVFL